KPRLLVAGQTCSPARSAWPTTVCCSWTRPRRPARGCWTACGSRWSPAGWRSRVPAAACPTLRDSSWRSEERRVGKEGRDRSAPEDEDDSETHEQSGAGEARGGE